MPRPSRAPLSPSDVPLKRRVVQMLALKDYDSMDLLDQLTREGLQLGEASQFSETLISVADVNNSRRGTVCCMKPESWKLVDITGWPFYTSAERYQVRLRNVDNFERNGSWLFPDLYKRSYAETTSDSDEKCEESETIAKKTK